MWKRTFLRLFFSASTLWNKRANAMLSAFTFIVLTYITHYAPAEALIERFHELYIPSYSEEITGDVLVAILAWAVYVFAERFRPGKKPPIVITEHDIESAISEGRLEVVLQPIYNLRTNTIDGFESLVRLHHDVYGVVLPRRFANLASFTDSQAAHSITAFALNKTAEYYQQFLKDGYDFQMAVSMFSVDLQDATLVDAVSRTLTIHDMPAERLTVEVTENALAVNADTSYKIVSGLKTLNVKLVLDDYGSHITSFVYFKDTQADGVKVAKSIVDKIQLSEANLEHAHSITHGIHSMGATVTAKHVEKQVTVSLLRKSEFDYVQGYVVAPPMTLEQAKAWLKTQRAMRLHARPTISE